MKRLNLGCGTDIRPGFVNADFIKTRPDVIEVDFEHPPYPFGDNEFDEIHSNNVLEHLGETKESFRNIIKEMVRITKDGGRWFIIVPHDTNASAHSEFHLTQYHWRSFRYDRRRTNPESEIFKNLEIIKMRHIFIKLLFWNFLVMPVAYLFPKFYENTCLRYLFPCQALYFEIRVRK